MVSVEREALKAVSRFQSFVGSVALAVEAVQVVVEGIGIGILDRLQKIPVSLLLSAFIGPRGQGFPMSLGLAILAEAIGRTNATA
jgi:hypothetical protein